MRAYTLTNNYGATGEGITYWLMYGYYEDEQAIHKEFARIYGDYMAQGVEIKEGFDTECEIARLLLTPKVRALLGAGMGMLAFAAMLHVNYS